MTTVLVTGASGFVGSYLVPRLSADHDVIALSRRATSVGGRAASGDHVTVRGDFASYEDLRALDAHEIDVVVHLASEIGGCPEAAGLEVNVLGTRTLMRYLIDRGCKRFVLASSIGANGCLTPEFLPRELPIPDDHPCDAVDAYGMSKALLEEVAFYLGRRHPELEIVLFRLGVVQAEEVNELAKEQLPETTLPFAVGGAAISLTDAVEAFALAAERPLGPGVRRMNLVGARSKTPIPVPEALERALGARAAALDLAHYRVEGHERDSLYATDRLREAYGLSAGHDLPSATAAADA
ncbi:MAG TPA: NAD(P)-dependent oxidoreductase [Conexibacter sp.]|nr:NAD(P)-dependent oxidoreductase [Conexibacter sp.]